MAWGSGGSLGQGNEIKPPQSRGVLSSVFTNIVLSFKFSISIILWLLIPKADGSHCASTYATELTQIFYWSEYEFPFCCCEQISDKKKEKRGECYVTSESQRVQFIMVGKAWHDDVTGTLH